MTKIYSNIMLDLETMGNGPTAAIVAIGAVCFDLEAGELGPTYYNRVSLEDAARHGGTIDASNVLWWLKQSDEARYELTRNDVAEISLFRALESFSVWIRQHADEDVAVWGNGASFDNVILRSAYERCAARPAPWKWRNDRCYRTIKAERPDTPCERIGTHHHAMSDAITQARHLIAIFDRFDPQARGNHGQ